MATTGKPSLKRRAKQAVKLALRRFRHRPLKAAAMVRDLRAMGVKPGGLLLVHSSLSSLGYVSGGARGVIDALGEALGPEGTLAMPTHSWNRMERGCREFDARRTPSCVGRITEVFRGLPGVVRSLHPTHSVAARGPLAERLVADHQESPTPCGDGTPYARLMDRGGQVLFLGVTLHVNTCFHGMEAKAGVPYLLREQPEEFTLVDASGRSSAALILRHRKGIARRFAQTEELLVREGIVRRGEVGPARSLLAEAGPMRDLIVPRLREDHGFLLAHPETDLPAAAPDRVAAGRA